MVVKVTKKENKNRKWAVVKINVNGKVMLLTVFEDVGVERVLIHGHVLDMPIEFGYAEKMIITQTDEFGRIKEICATGKFE